MLASGMAFADVHDKYEIGGNELLHIDPDRPRGIFLPIEDPAAHEYREPGARSHGGGHILFLNRCAGGQTFSPGGDNSRTNRSGVVAQSTGSPVNFPAYPYGDSSWNQVVAHVQDIMSPFNISVTDVDPGNTPHHEAVICGSPGLLGMDSNVGGVALFGCSVLENSVTFTFPTVWGNSPRSIAETVGQEAAHAWGLDHEYECKDPMTYLFGCGNKSFQNEYISCGEYSARSCYCGGSTQNSYQKIMSIFGPASASPPSVEITSPQEGAQVGQGFPVAATISDDQGVQRAELFVDGTFVMQLTSSPYTFNAPSNLSDGGHQVRVVAYDTLGSSASDTINVIVGEPCGGPSDCDDGETCVDGRCVPGPGTDGGLGDTCEDGADCASGLCGNDGTNKYCTEACNPDADACPGGFNCINAGEGNGVCWPGGDDGGGEGGGCVIASDDASGERPFPWTGAGLALVVGLGLALSGRRRR